MIGVILPFHLACAFFATATFWGAGLARKGGRVHRFMGRWFARFVYATAMTGGAMASVELAVPSMVGESLGTSEAARLLNHQMMWLVLYVLLIIVAPVQHGVAVAAAGANPASVRSVRHLVLSLGCLIGTLLIIPAAIAWQQWLFLIVAPIGAIVGLRNLAYANRAGATREDWDREHLTSMITAGITLHTALLVFGTSRSLGWQLSGLAQVLPWTLPAVVGLPVILILRSSWVRRG